MKKLLTFLTLLTLSIGVGWADEYSWTLSYTNFVTTNGTSTSGGSTTQNSVSWDFSASKFVGTENGTGGKGVQFGSKSNPDATFTLSTTGIPGTITKVDVEASAYSSSATIGVSVGGTSYGSSNLGTTNSTKSFSGSSSGKIIITLTNASSGGRAMYLKSIKVTYSTGSTTTYSLTLPTGLTGGTVTSNYSGDLTQIASGTNITVTATPSPGYTLEWMKANGTEVQNPYTFAIAENTTITASFVQEQASTTQWVLTSPSNLTTGDVVLIVDKYSSRAMSNDNGTSNPPSATSVVLNTEKTLVTSGANDNLQWLVTKNSAELIFGIPPAGTTHLYCINTNNGVKVGSGDNDRFNITNDYLYNIGTERYLGVYNNQDWRCYDNTTGNIANTEIAFYKKVETGSHTVTVGTITGEGTINPSSGSANTGDVITVTAEPATGYELTALAYNGTPIDITSTPYTFTMPDADVTLTATFSAINYNIYRTITAQNPNDQGGWIGNWNENCNLPDGAQGTDYVVTSTYGKEVQFKVGNNEGYKILAENVSAKDANNNNVPLTVVSSDNSGIVFKFNMPASNVTISAYFTFYQPDMYLMGTANDQNWQQTYKMTYSNDQYTIRAYFAGQSASDPYGYFQFEGDGTRYASGAEGEYWPISENGTGESHFGDQVPLYANSSKNFRVPAGIYDIVINKDRNKVTVNPVAVNITFSPAADEVNQGTNVTATSDLYSLLHAINSGVSESNVSNQVSLDGNSFSNSVALSTIGTQTVTGKASYGQIAITGTKNYTVNEVDMSNVYTLVESEDDLVAGGEYLIVGSTVADPYSAILGPWPASGNYATAIKNNFTYNATNKTITLEDGCTATPLTLDGSEGAWTFYNGSGYLAYTSSSTSSNNNLWTVSNASDNGATWTIDTDELPSSTDLIVNVYNSSRKLNYNSDRFAGYVNAQSAVALFKKATPSNKSAAPVITPESGNVVGYSQEVEITQSNGGNIYYTIDGTTPNENSTPYNGKFWVEGNLGDVVTVIAVAKETGKELSNTVTVNYKFVAPAAPVFTPGAGTYTTPQTVTVSTTTEGADVYYTATAGLSAAQIVAQGTKFEEPFTVSTPTTYYAVTVYHDAHANRDALSGIRQAQYKFSEVESVDLPYSRPFTDSEGFGDGEFTIQDDENPDEITVWTVSTQYGAKGTSFTSNPNTNHAATSWLLSPYINLGDAEEPVLTFVHQINRHFTNPSTQATVWIKSYGGEWAQLTTGLPENSNGIGSGEWPSYDEEYDLSAYKGQIVQIGFKYDNPTAGSGAGTWEIQNFLVADNAPIEVENIAEYLALPIGTSNIKFKNPVIVQYHYISDSGKSYIYVKDDSGCAYFHQPADGETINQLANGDIIAGGFTGNKVADEMVSDEESNFAMFTDLENFAPNGDKGLADPEHETVARIADATTGVALNNHYITIKKVKLSALYKPEDVTYGDPLYFDIDNEAHIGYNKFHIDWSVVDDLDAYYNITGIQTAYNNKMEFHPTEIVKWEESVVTLRQLCDEGITIAGENEYTISNNLMCVFAKGNSIWVKDDTGQSIWPATPTDGDLNFEVYAEAAEGVPANTRLNQAYYDQSNWCEIKLADGVDASQFVGKIIKGGSIHGNFTDKLNPTLENVTLTSAAISSEGDYAPNYYMPANFFGRQACQNSSHSTDFGQNYFYMTPKPQEYAQIVWAVWNDKDNRFIMSTSDNDNGHRFEGEFSIDLSLNTGVTATGGIQPGYGYNFKAIIKKTESKDAGYMVYPLDLDEGIDPATSINTVDVTGKAVKSVKYVNVAGMVSDVPFQGVNIVVTEYTDGSRTTSKMLRK